MPEAQIADKPPVSIGHVAMAVADVPASHAFYAALGLRTLDNGEDLAILELRGGTHLLLFRRGGAAASADSPFDQKSPEIIDLMIEGRTFADLDAYRSALLASGVAADPIPDERYFGHYVFKTKDPDGNEVTVSTSHASNQPI